MSVTTTTLDPVTQFTNIVMECLDAVVQNQTVKTPVAIYSFFLDNYLDNIVDEAITATGATLDSSYVASLKTKIDNLKVVLESKVSVIGNMLEAKGPARKAKKSAKNPVTTTTTTTTVAP